MENVSSKSFKCMWSCNTSVPKLLESRGFNHKIKWPQQCIWHGVLHISSHCSHTLKATENYVPWGGTHSVCAQCAHVSMVTEMEKQSQTLQIVFVFRVRAQKITQKTALNENGLWRTLLRRFTAPPWMYYLYFHQPVISNGSTQPKGPVHQSYTKREKKVITCIVWTCRQRFNVKDLFTQNLKKNK